LERSTLSLHDALPISAVFLVVFFALVLGAWGKLPRFDPPIYFEFADRRVFFGVSNSMDVLSNLAFLWVGIHWWRFVSMFGAYRPDRKSTRLNSSHVKI